jgi:hypothetical protein
VDNLEEGSPGYPVGQEMYPGKLFIGGKLGSLGVCTLREGPPGCPSCAAGGRNDWVFTRELQEFGGVSSTHHPIYYHQNNAENHDFQWYK